jgi:hypothetical protein
LKFEILITNLLQTYENLKQTLDNGIQRWQYGIVVDEKDGDKMRGDEMHLTMKYFSLLTFDGNRICHVTMEVMTIVMKSNVS